ncbi:MAG: AAA family ATPase [Chitinophagaceae bacterium]|nr:AAA family ATPase [Chitinophagaceae bacterium]
MELKKSSRKRAKIRLALQGPSGSGKTYSALLIALGLCKNFDKVAVIDTENHSSELYSHLGTFNVVTLEAPFTPERYIEAIKLCERAGMEAIIVDSISHQWEGSGGILETHSLMTGNSFTNWGKLTPRHNSFVQAILQSPCHVIATIRSKQDYVLSEKNGKQVPEKIGLKGVTRDGMDYEMTILLDIDIKHNAVASKDRTGLFMDKPEFRITSAVGDQILAWCQEGIEETKDEFADKIKACVSYDQLKKLYTDNPQHQASYADLFGRRKNEVLTPGFATPSFTQNISQNGNGTLK